MKLLTKTLIVYLSMTLVLFAIGGGIFYFSLREIIDENLTENLEQTQEQVIDYVKKNGVLPAQHSVGSDLLIFYPSDEEIKTELKDTIFYSEYEEEELPYRELVFSVKTNDGLFTAIAGKPIIESDDLIESIAGSLGAVGGILLVVLFLFNWVVSKNMWSPFYKTLDSLRKFDIGKKEPIGFSPTAISEFKILNEEISKMTGKMVRDFQNLKEFTENASHELQTPLAIIRSKLELMIQSENIPQEQMKMIQDIYESTNRLSKLNQSLLLLAKIENRQFHEAQEVDIKKLIGKKLEQFEDMIAFKQIQLFFPHSQVEGEIVNMNPQLADILLSNIIGNAIRHNVTGGKLTVELKNNSVTVSNTGTLPNVSPEKLFERFQKASTSAESVGLGLSIVKQICDTYGYRINYTFSEGIHTVTVFFRTD